MTEYRLGKHTIKFTPHNIMPTNSEHERTIHTKIEVYRKGILGRSKLIYTRKYQPLPALTVYGFFRDMDRLEIKKPQ